MCLVSVNAILLAITLTLFCLTSLFNPLSWAKLSGLTKSNSVYVIKIETRIQMEQFSRRKVHENQNQENSKSEVNMCLLK
jgi:hypothetical protein